MNDSSSINALTQQLSDGIASLGLQAAAQHPIDAYCSYMLLLAEWNKAYNLTAIREPAQMVAYHVLDSLAVLPYLHGDACLDVGTGAGLPGLILALAEPDKHWVLLDGNHKKIRFINQAVMELKLNNVEVICCRAEDFKPDKYFSTIISRAIGNLHCLYQCAFHLLLPSGRLFAMKGPEVNAEIAELNKTNVKSRVHLLDIPGVSSQRSLVELRVFPSGN
ncbi:MAG: 16S rRNA (guanine(527)-N(7))-methyltransferase RsmG [Gammaproteobacteria bacterium]